MERQVVRPEMRNCFGRYKGRTCQSIYNEDRNYCEWVSRQESTNPALVEFQDFSQTAEREWENESGEEKRRELKEREKKLEENRRAAASEMEGIPQLVQETRDMLAEVDAECSMTTAMRRDSKTTTKKNDTMAAAR